jgi:preprotein translocase subunit SecB
MENAAFRLKHYIFDKINLNFENVNNDSTLVVDFKPSGEFEQAKGLFTLTFLFEANVDEFDEYVISVRCKAVFEFKEPLSLKDIPSFFYPNSIAILYPYVRAFVGTLSLQSNIKPIMLPTLNLSGLEGILRNQTRIVE